MWDETVSKVCGLHHSLWPTPLINFLPKGIMSLQYYDWHFGYSNLKFGLKAKHSWQTTFVFPPNANVNIHNHVQQNFLVSRSGKARKIVDVCCGELSNEYNFHLKVPSQGLLAWRTWLNPILTVQIFEVSKNRFKLKSDPKVTSKFLTGAQNRHVQTH